MSTVPTTTTTGTAAPASVTEAKPTKPDGAPITITTTPIADDTDTDNVASSKQTEWKITIKSSDGTTSEVVLSPVSAKNPVRQEVNIYMPGAKAKSDDGDGDGDVEKAKAEPEPAPPSKKMRYYTTIQQLLTAIFSLIIIAVEVLTLVKYRSTENVAGAWPVNPLLTPTYVLLVMAVLSCTADMITFGVNCCYGNIRNQMMDVVAKIRGSLGFLQALASAAGAGYFKWAQSSSGNADLWGWSCSDAADAMQNVNSSGTLCSSNWTAWALAILQMVLHILTVVMAVWALLKPEGSFKDHTADASQVLADGQATEMKIQTDFGPPAKM